MVLWFRFIMNYKFQWQQEDWNWRLELLGPKALAGSGIVWQVCKKFIFQILLNLWSKINFEHNTITTVKFET